MKKRMINVGLICLILFSILTIRGQFLEGETNHNDYASQVNSFTEQEITEEANKKLRCSFIENQGQITNEEVLIYGYLPNGKIAFGQNKVMFWMDGTNDIITLGFVGAQKVSPIGLDELVTKNNYFLGNRGTYTDVRNFGAILYIDLWKGIDLYYQNTPSGAKYEFRVAPYANPEDISVSCKGQEQLVIGKDSLKFLVSDGLFVDEGLKVLQENKEIDAKFVAKGSNTFGFQLSKYDENKPLVIDPLIYSTIIGDFRDDEAWSIALDGEGNAYVTGKTESIDFPTTPGAYNETYNGGEWDCFVFKLSADFSTLLYSTYVGGISHDGGSSIVLDNSGQVYVTGFTSSSDFPTTSDAYNRIFGGGYDCFVFRLSSSGSSLSYSSFFGGIGLDLGDSIALYNDNVVYVTGKAGSANFPTTVGAYNETFSAIQCDCFVFKLSADGVSLLYSTFVGGNGIDRVQSIAVDDEGNAYVTGYTSSSNFPTTLNAYNRTFGGVDDCFVFKLSTYGSTLLYSTFIGGNESEFGNSIALDNNGNAFVTGSTLSSNFPTTLNAYNRTYGGEGDCFVFKLSADSSSLLYSTFVGGNSSDGGYSIALDSEWNAHVTGYTSSSNFPTTLGAYDETYDDGGCIVFKLSADGSSLLYSTRIGGTDHENGESIALDSEGNAYVTGYTSSNDFPTTVRPFDFGPGGGSLKNVFVFKISLIAKTKRFGEPILKTNTLTITTLTLFTLITIFIKKRRKRK